MLETHQEEIAFLPTQRGDLKQSNSAMAGDIIRGLVECITNSDDSYARIEHIGQKANGPILIEIDRNKGARKFTVRDRAEGMSYNEMQENLRKRGVRSSGFEKGANVRGNLGFGVKDLLGLGAFEFESIKDGRYSCFAVKENANLDKDKVEDRRVTPADMKNLGVRNKNGSSVTVHLRKGVNLPTHANLENKIRSHYELRAINQSPDREILLQDSSTGGSRKILYADPLREMVYEETIKIAGYPEAQANLVIFRNAEQDQSLAKDPTRPSGIIIQGRKARYENTLFSFENNPIARQFSGLFQCRYIDQLAMEFDDRLEKQIDHTQSNPIDIIKLNRQGLETNHPFRSAIQKAVDPILEELIKKEEAGRDKEAQLSRSTRQNLSALGRALAKQFDLDLQDHEQEMITGSVTGKDVSTLPDISLIPTKLIFDPNQKKTLSIRMHNKFVVREVKPQVKIDADPPRSLEVLDRTLFKQDQKFDDFSLAQVRLKATADFGYAHVEVTAGECPDTATAEAEVSGEYEEPLPIEEFQFQYRSVRCKVNQKKRISLFIPVELLDKEETEPHVTVDDSQLFNVSSKSDWEFDEDLLAFEKVVSVEGRQLGATSIVRATLGKHRAQCQVKIRQSESENSIDVKFLNEKREFLRAETIETSEGVTIWIMGAHDIMKMYLGDGPEFPYQDTKQAQMMVAEVVAAEAAEKMLERITKGSDLDGADYNTYHREYMDKYLRLTHKILVTSD